MGNKIMFNSKNNKSMNELIIKSMSEQTQAEYRTEKYNVNVNITTVSDKVEAVYETFLNTKDNGYVANVNIRVEADGSLRYNLDVAKSDDTENVVAVAREIEKLVFKTEKTTLEETSEKNAVAE